MLSTLPEDLLLLIVHFMDVESALSLLHVAIHNPRRREMLSHFQLQTCRLLNALANTKSFWLELVQRMHLTRPVPIYDPCDATLVDLRRAILQARALESKFHIYGEDVTTIQCERWRKLDPLPLPDPDMYLEYNDAWVMLLRDRKHMFQMYTGALCIRSVLSGDVVARIPFEGDIDILRHSVYKGQAVVGVLSMAKSQLLYVLFWPVSLSLLIPP